MMLQFTRERNLNSGNFHFFVIFVTLKITLKVKRKMSNPENFLLQFTQLLDLNAQGMVRAAQIKLWMGHTCERKL